MGPTPRPCNLFRYSTKHWLERSLKLGEFRLVPATNYKELDGDLARQDDELITKTTIPANLIKATHIPTGQPLKVVRDMLIEDEFRTNYYLLSFSTKFKEHFFDDFSGSDSCLVVHAVEEVSERILYAASKVLHGWVGIDDAISYGGEHGLGAMFMKNVKYFFQYEWRFAWVPPQTVQELVPFNIQIGNIEQFAEVVAKPLKEK